MTRSRMRTKRWFLAPLLVLAIAMIAAACGGDDDGDVATEIAAVRAEVAELRETANTALLSAPACP